MTIATGYLGVVLLAITLLLGPANLLLRKRNPVSTYLRRDVGIWAAILSAIHVVAAVLIHVSHGSGPLATVLHFFFNQEGRLLINSFGLGNWTGLAALVIAASLLATSSDAALRTLKARRWKAIQRLTYMLFGLVVLHALFYGALLRTTSPFTLLLIVSVATVVPASGSLAMAAEVRRHGTGVSSRRPYWRNRHMNIGRTMKVAIVAGVAATAVAFASIGASGFARQDPAAWTPSVVSLPTPAGSNTGEPQLTGSSRGVLLSWIEHVGSTTTLRFAERTSNGWTEPRTVASGQDWSINAIDVPAVLRLSNGAIVGQWLQTAGSSMHANDVRLSYSKDDGRSWAPSFTPYREGTQSERLFASLFEMPGGGLGMVWLNGRSMQPGTANADRVPPNQSHAGGDHGGQRGAGHQGHDRGAQHSPAGPMGDMSLRFATFDNAWKQSADMPIDSRVCECCSTAAVVTSEGVLAAYRNRSDDEVRDIYVSRLDHGQWTEGSVVHAENWQIPMCPINGPALSAAGRDVAITWYTAKQEQGHAYLAFSGNAGRTFGQPIRLDDGTSLGRVDVELLPDGSAVASWIEFADGRGQFRVRHVTRDGARSGAVTVAGLAAGGRASGTPRIARHGDELVLAWTESNNGSQQVRTGVARLPRNTTR